MQIRIYTLSLILLMISTNESPAAMPCPPMPKAVTEVTRNVKSDINASAASLGKVKAGEVATKTEVFAKNLFEKYPNVDRLVALQTMAATYCAMLINSTTLSEKDKLNRWERFQEKVLNIQSLPTSNKPSRNKANSAGSKKTVNSQTKEKASESSKEQTGTVGAQITSDKSEDLSDQEYNLKTNNSMFNNDPNDHPLFGVSNYTKDPTCTTCWAQKIKADPGDIISFMIYYHNTSNTVSESTNVRVSLPKVPFKTKNIGAEITNTRSGNGARATVDMTSDCILSYIPGSLEWYPDRQKKSQKVPFEQDGKEIITTDGLNIGNVIPGWEGQGYIVFRAKATPINYPSILSN